MTMQSLCGLLLTHNQPAADAGSSDGGTSTDTSDSESSDDGTGDDGTSSTSSSDGTETSEDSDSQASSEALGFEDHKQAEHVAEEPARRCLTCYDRILDANWTRHTACRRHTRMQAHHGQDAGWARQLPKPLTDPSHEVPFLSLHALATIAGVPSDMHGLQPRL
jgi:hypothetical protein